MRRLFGKSTSVQAVSDVSFSVQRGETVGLLGSNGAGKSTIVKMVTGLLRPTSGDVLIDGFDPWRSRRECARKIGLVLGQRTQLVYDTPLRASFSLIRDIYGIPQDVFVSRLAKLSELLDLDRILDRPVRFLSLGERMRSDLTAALLPAPQILFLDEPTIGLDAVAKEAIYSFLQQLREQGSTTIVLTSHDMRDVERLCDRIIVVDRGSVKYDGPIVNLKEKVQTPAHAVVGTSDLEVDVEDLRKGIPPAVSVSMTFDDARDMNVFDIAFDTGMTTAAEIVTAVVRVMTIVDIRLIEASLDDVLLALYREYDSDGGRG